MTSKDHPHAQTWKEQFNLNEHIFLLNGYIFMIRKIPFPDYENQQTIHFQSNPRIRFCSDLHSGTNVREPFYHDGMIDRLQRIGKATGLRITDLRTVLTFPGWF